MLIFLAIPAAATTAVEAPAIASLPSNLTSFVDAASKEFGIPAEWIWAVMDIESHQNPAARSSKGAMGLMQLMPGTWARLSQSLDLGVDPYDPRNNIRAGAAYLRQMYDAYGRNGFLAAYNAGPGRYESHLKTGQNLPEETISYVAKLSQKLGANEPDGVQFAPRSEPTRWPQAPIFVTVRNASITADSTLFKGTSTPFVRAVEAPSSSQ